MGRFKKLNCKQLFTVEPVVFFYAYGLFMHLPVIQQYIYHRIAKAEGFPYSTSQSGSCGNTTMLNDTMKDLEKKVQSSSSYFHIGVVMFSSIPSLIASLLIGSWTDSRGRKPALFLPALGSTLEAVVTILVIYFEWPLYILFVGGAINGICGYFTTMVMAVMAYIADTTDEGERPVRLAILELLTFLGGMVSQLTSGLWIEKYGFIAPYWFILGCLLFSVLYAMLFVPESRPPSTIQEKVKFCSCKSLRRVYRVYNSPREGGRRNLILLTLSSAIMQMTVQGVNGVIILFVIHTPLCFSPGLVGAYSAFRCLTIGVGAIIGIKLLGKCISELTITKLGIFSRVGALVMLSFAKTTVMVFLVPLVALFYGCVVPLIRGMMSRIVSADEQGALFSATASLETLATFLGTFLFNTLYPVSLKMNFDGLVFIIGAAVALIPFCFVMCFLKNPMSLLSKKDRVRIVGNYETMPDDNLNDPTQTSVNVDESSPISDNSNIISTISNYTDVTPTA